MIGTSFMSDDSEMDYEDQEEEKYRRKYLLLLDRCESIQRENERLVYRYVMRVAAFQGVGVAKSKIIRVYKHCVTTTGTKKCAN